MTYERLAGLLYNTPLLLAPDKAEVVANVFETCLRGGIDSLPKGMTEAEREALVAKEYAALLTPARRVEGGYYMTERGVALVPVHGSLVQRAGLFDSLSGMTSYQTALQRIDAALRDSMVRGIVLDVDSPGGEVAGVAELAEFIRKAHKPVWAVANELAASAAYWIASAAERLILPTSAQVGSIGVLVIHADRSAIVEKSGVRYTAIYAGAKKLDGSSLAPLSESARIDLTRRVDAVYGMFVDAVAGHRGMSAEDVRATEAGMMGAADAVLLGFADEAGTLSSSIQALQAEVTTFGFQFKPRGERASHKDSTMTTEAKNPPAATVEQLATERAAGYADAQKELATKAVEAAAAATARIAAILGHEEAKTRRASAEHLAFKTSMSTEDAIALLATMPKDVTSTNPLDTALRGTNPKVGADTDKGGEESKVSIDSTNVYTMRRQQVADYVKGR